MSALSFFALLLSVRLNFPNIDEFLGGIYAVGGQAVMRRLIGFYNLKHQCVCTHFASYNCAAKVA